MDRHPSSHEVKLSLQTPLNAEQAEILTDDAFLFVERLVQRFAGRVPALLAAREARQQRIDEGALPDFYLRRRRSVTVNGKSSRSRRICRIVAWKLLALLSAKW
ncbi:malate synthase [Photobacterium aphoticum]|uniref:Malate synthase n=1 Tax=Photobacterium aphoticum TaxID=754436 RepID=A0A090RM97_9GAMM|nr:malate synthase [Photobacterium aphoticum]